MKKLAESKKSGILICGAYGTGNTGDEAILSVLLKKLEDLGEPITVLTRTPAALKKRLKNDEGRAIAAVYSLDPIGVMRATQKCRVLIMGGGGLFQNVTSSRSLMYYLLVMSRAHDAGAECFLYSCGFGPIIGAEDLELTEKVIKNCVSFAAARDPATQKALLAAGLTQSEAMLMSDLAVDMEVPAPRETGLHECYTEDDRGCAIFAVRDWDGFSTASVSFANTATELYKSRGLLPVFLPLGVGDAEAALRICALLRNTPYILLPEGLPPLAAAEAIASAEVCVSMRLHGLVFAALGTVPAVGVAYDEKVSLFADSMGYESMALGDADDEKLKSAVFSALDNKDKSNLQKALASLKEKNAICAAELKKRIGKDG